MTDYLSHAMTLVDSLAIASSPISDQELILFILGGLGLEYDNLVVSLTTRANSLTLDDLQGQLYTNEIRLNKTTSLLEFVPMANTATTPSSEASQSL